MTATKMKMLRMRSVGAWWLSRKCLGKLDSPCQADPVPEPKVLQGELSLIQGRLARKALGSKFVISFQEEPCAARPFVVPPDGRKYCEDLPGGPRKRFGSTSICDVMLTRPLSMLLDTQLCVMC